MTYIYIYLCQDQMNDKVNFFFLKCAWSSNVYISVNICFLWGTHLKTLLQEYPHMWNHLLEYHKGKNIQRMHMLLTWFDNPIKKHGNVWSPIAPATQTYRKCRVWFFCFRSKGTCKSAGNNQSDKCVLSHISLYLLMSSTGGQAPQVEAFGVDTLGGNHILFMLSIGGTALKRKLF